MFNSLDLFLLNKFQRASDWFQDWFGIDNFMIAKILKWVTLIFWLLKVIFSIIINNMGILSVYTSVTIPGLIFVSAFIIHSGEVSCRSNPSFKNPAAETLSVMRSFWILIFIICCIMIPLNVTAWIEHTDIPKETYKAIDGLCMELRDVFLGFFIYFGCCTPKPYKTSKIKKFTEKVSEAISNAKERISFPNPVLSPVHATN